MNYIHRLLNILYQLSKVIRTSLLASQFGYVSQCTHYPTCGEYTVEAVKKRGFWGLIDGLSRVSKCLIIPNKRNLS